MKKNPRSAIWPLLILTLLTLLTIGGRSSFGATAPQFGRYLGVLHHDRLNQDQLAKLDLIPDKPEGETLNLIAVLTLHFGDYASGQYVSYRFGRVRYNPLAGTIAFNANDQDITLNDVELSATTLEANLYSAFGEEKIGKLSLRRDRAADPKSPIIRPIGGDYLCDDGSMIQLDAIRSTVDRANIGNPFGSYELHGRVGKRYEDLGGMVVRDEITSANYNFFKGRMVLLGGTNPITCGVDDVGISCDNGCVYRSSKRAHALALVPPGAKDGVSPPGRADEKPAIAGSVDLTSGEYQGYVHHEYLDSYQAASLNISVYPSEGGEGGTIRLGAVAKLLFGEGGRAEAISYSLKEDSYPIQNTHLVFSNPGADAIVDVTTLAEDHVKGVWYSSLFGRVGEFELFRDRHAHLPAGARRIDEIAGIYQGKVENSKLLWKLNLVTGLGPSSSMNPASPIQFGGSLSMLDPDLGEDRANVSAGSYDFYTGRIGLLLGKGAMLVAHPDAQGTMHSHWYLSSDFGSGFFTYRGMLSVPRH